MEGQPGQKIFQKKWGQPNYFFKFREKNGPNRP
jgi:hypothetical protein